MSMRIKMIKDPSETVQEHNNLSNSMSMRIKIIKEQNEIVCENKRFNKLYVNVHKVEEMNATSRVK